MMYRFHSSDQFGYFLAKGQSYYDLGDLDPVSLALTQDSLINGTFPPILSIFHKSTNYRSHKMRRILGRSGIEISAVGMGCWAIGGLWTFMGEAAGWGQLDMLLGRGPTLG